MHKLVIRKGNSDEVSAIKYMSDIAYIPLSQQTFLGVQVHEYQLTNKPFRAQWVLLPAKGAINSKPPQRKVGRRGRLIGTSPGVV